MSSLKTSVLKEPRQRKYTARDFDSLRAQLVQYARKFYPNNIQDFSDNGLGALLIDLASYVGDSLHFYLDHQFQELDPRFAIEDKNIERHLQNSGVNIVGAAPAHVPVTFYVQIPAITINNVTQPDSSLFPIIKAGTILSSNNNVSFILVEDIDFNVVDVTGKLLATQTIGKTTTSGAIQTYVLSLSGVCVSGTETTDTFTINDTFVPFRKLTLTNANVSQIISVVDSYGNQYYEVSALTDDVVYENIPNVRDDQEDVPETIKIIPAPYRFISNVALNTRKTTLTFGGGSASTLDDDVIPDPSEFAINFPYRRTFVRSAINPSKMLNTKTLGVATVNTELTVHYRYGGGLSHNVGVNEIRTIETLQLVFPNNPSSAQASFVRRNIEVSNLEIAQDGEDPPTVDELKTLIPIASSAQERVVSRPDLLARVFTMPSNFGRCYRAAVRTNPNNTQASQLFIVSRAADGTLTMSSDTLKLNLVKYLNPYRLINDSIDILDSQIINFQIQFEVVIDPTLNKSVVLQQVLLRLKSFFRIQNFSIDQPIILSEVRNQILAIQGIISLNSVVISNVSGQYNGKTYNENIFDITSNTIKDILFPPPGGIFELKYPDIDLIGKAV